MPDATLSAAIREAYASAASDQVIHHTLEVWHPAFSTPVRVVRDRVDLTARLEASAPRDAGQLVSFIAFAFDVVPPDATPHAVPQCVIEIDNVSRDLLAQVELAMTSSQHIEIIYRAYLSGRTAIGPENDPPLTLAVLSLSATVHRLRATCGYPDLANLRFPREDYTAERFPGLIAQ